VEKQRVTAKSIRQAGKGKQIDGKMKKKIKRCQQPLLPVLYMIFDSPPLVLASRGLHDFYSVDTSFGKANMIWKGVTGCVSPAKGE
jgi:hypothetical protein